MSLRVAVVVPAFNEERLIARTLRSIPSWVECIVVVDDGSCDRTSEEAQVVGDERIDIVRHDDNRGVGAAIGSGYRRAFANGVDVCVVMAADGQMDPRDLTHLLAPVRSGEAGYVKGDRLSFPRAHRLMPWTRWLGNVILARLTSLATGLTVRDSQCGYTAIRRETAAQLPLERLWPRYGYPNDLLGMLAERGEAVAEVAVRPVYADEDSGIGLRHALFVVPFVLLRVWLRRQLIRFSAAAPAPSLEP